MSVFAFLPSYEGTDLEAELSARGLGDLLEPGILAIPTRVTKGPSGQPGVLVTFQPPDDVPREYDAKTQTWLEAPPDGELAKGRYWVGYANARRPTPELLQRRTIIDGESVLLADNRVWIVPCCEHAPKRITRDVDTGTEKQVTKNEYRQWVERSNEIFGLIMADGFGMLSDANYRVKIPGGLRYCAQSLRNNYRVNADVLDLLQLIDDSVISEVILAACGITALATMIIEKKNTGEPCHV